MEVAVMNEDGLFPFPTVLWIEKPVKEKPWYKKCKQCPTKEYK